MKPNLRTRLFANLKNSFAHFASSRLNLSVAETDNTFYTGGALSSYYRDRTDWDRQKIFSECLRAWRVNPLARRIVKLTKQFIIGEGLAISSPHKATNKFLTEWWDHPLNNFDHNVPRWLDEQTRAGNLFFLCSVGLDGMLYVRAVPVDLVKEIQSADNDVEQERYFIPHDMQASPWSAYDPETDQDSFMLHFAVNQPVGTPWGEPDLAPLLVWIGRFSAWLEDRARLNRFRNTFVWTLKKNWQSKKEKQERQAALNANPPQPGSFLLLDESEVLEAPVPKLESHDAHFDGMDLKKMIAAGTPFPLHYLAEPESATRTTAEAAGTATFRDLEQMQNEFCDMIISLARIALAVRKHIRRGVNTGAEIVIARPDITERDNSLLALAVNRIWPPLADLFDRHMINEGEFMRLIYRMAGESEPPSPLGEGRGGVGIRRPIESPAENKSVSKDQPEDKEEDK